MDLDKFKNPQTRTFIDTCSIMHQNFPKVMDVLAPLLESANTKLIIPKSCIRELVIHINSDDSKKKEIAQKAMLNLENYRDHIEIKGEESDSKHADNVFQYVFTKFRVQYNLILLTEDKGLTADILKLNNNLSVKGNEIEVFSLKTILKWKKENSPFKIQTKITSVPNKKINLSHVPTIGDTISAYDSNGKQEKITLIEEINSGGEGTVFRTNTSDVAKIFKKDKLFTHKYNKIILLIQSGIKIEGICFPSRILKNDQDEFVGYLMPLAEGKSLDSTTSVS